MSNRFKNLNQKYYIALGIGIAVILLLLDFVPNIFQLFYFYGFIRIVGSLVASVFLIFALVKIVSKTFTPYVYSTIIMLLIGAIIAIIISIIFEFDFILKIIVIVICVVVLGFIIKVKKEEVERSQEEVSPQQKIVQRQYNTQLLKFAVGAILMVIGVVVAIIDLLGLGGLGVSVSNLNNIGGYILLGILVGIPFVVFIVPGYFLFRSAYRKSTQSKK